MNRECRECGVPISEVEEIHLLCPPCCERELKAVELDEYLDGKAMDKRQRDDENS